MEYRLFKWKFMPRPWTVVQVTQSEHNLVRKSLPLSKAVK